MRNLHLIVVNAESPVAACRKVENELNDWGGTTYVLAFISCVSEDDEHYYEDGVSWDYKDRDQKLATLEQFNQMVIDYLHEWIDCGENSKTEVQDGMRRWLAGEKLDSELWYTMSSFCEDQSELDPTLAGVPVDTFNVLEDELRNNEYNEFGVTHLAEDDEDVSKRYVVLFEMYCL